MDYQDFHLEYRQDLDLLNDSYPVSIFLNLHLHLLRIQNQAIFGIPLVQQDKHGVQEVQRN